MIQCSRCGHTREADGGITCPSCDGLTDAVAAERLAATSFYRPEIVEIIRHNALHDLREMLAAHMRCMVFCYCSGEDDRMQFHAREHMRLIREEREMIGLP
jgi:hypothetical protein